MCRLRCRRRRVTACGCSPSTLLYALSSADKRRGLLRNLSAWLRSQGARSVVAGAALLLVLLWLVAPLGSRTPVEPVILPPIPPLPATFVRPRAMSWEADGLSPSRAAAHLVQQLEHEPWTSRQQPFVNVFLVWMTHRDTWGLVNDRVLESVVRTIPNARVRVFSNSLPRAAFDALVESGFDVAVVPYDLASLAAGMPGSDWLRRATASPGLHTATQLSDFTRLVLLYRFGGLYVDTDALWLQDVATLPPSFIGKVDFLKLAPNCSFCIDERWYLANGVMSFEARHPFLLTLLRRIDSEAVDPSSRVAIGPPLVTTTYVQQPPSQRAAVALLEEGVLYPISGAKVPQFMAKAKKTLDLRQSHSLHVFLYTYKYAVVQPRSVIGAVLDSVRVLHRDALCHCVPRGPAAGHLCTPHSAVIEFASALVEPPPPRADGSTPRGVSALPYSRLCVRMMPGHDDASVTVTMRAEKGALQSLAWSMRRSMLVQLERADGYWSDELAGLEYVHLGGYCNDVVTFTVEAGSRSWSSTVLVSAPCIDARNLHVWLRALRRKNPKGGLWAAIGPVVPPVTATAVTADPTLRRNFTRCVASPLGLAAVLGFDVDGAAAAVTTPVTGPPSAQPDRELRVALLVSATGSYVSWVDDLLLSAEEHFMRGHDVQYFVLTDRGAGSPSEPPLVLHPRDRVHAVWQPQLGWPYDSMFRHQLYIKHAARFETADFIMVLDADARFVAPVGPEIVGRTMGCLQAFQFGQAFETSPFETRGWSGARMSAGPSSCYFAGGLFGGSGPGFLELLHRTTWLTEWDLLNVGVTASHDDESYLNKVFHEHRPDAALPANYIYPEPPADRLWSMSGQNWKAAFPPKIMNLGARKWLDATAARDRQYSVVADPVSLLQSMADDSVPSNRPSDTKTERGTAAAARAPRAGVTVTLGMCGTGLQRHAHAVSVAVGAAMRWYDAGVAVVIVDVVPTSGAGGDSGPSVRRAATEPWSDVLSLRSSWVELVEVHVPPTSLPSPPWHVSECPAEALVVLLQHVQSRHVLLLRQPLALTWQHALPFLARVTSGELEAPARTADFDARYAAVESADGKVNGGDDEPAARGNAVGSSDGGRASVFRQRAADMDGAASMDGGPVGDSTPATVRGRGRGRAVGGARRAQLAHRGRRRGGGVDELPRHTDYGEAGSQMAFESTESPRQATPTLVHVCALEAVLTECRMPVPVNESYAVPWPSSECGACRFAAPVVPGDVDGDAAFTDIGRGGDAGDAGDGGGGVRPRVVARVLTPLRRLQCVSMHDDVPALSTRTPFGAVMAETAVALAAMQTDTTGGGAAGGGAAAAAGGGAAGGGAAAAGGGAAAAAGGGGAASHPCDIACQLRRRMPRARSVLCLDGMQPLQHVPAETSTSTSAE
jgi:hypothetical protein